MCSNVVYAIVKAGGRQEKVAVGDVVVVDRLAAHPQALSRHLAERADRAALRAQEHGNSDHALIAHGPDLDAHGILQLQDQRDDSAERKPDVRERSARGVQRVPGRKRDLFHPGQ